MTDQNRNSFRSTALCPVNKYTRPNDTMEIEFREEFESHEKNNNDNHYEIYNDLKDFLQTTTFHGVRYIVESKSNFRR